MMCVTTTDMRAEGFCEVRDCTKNINNNNKKSSGNNNNKCNRDEDFDVHSDLRNAEYNSKNISNSCKIGGCDGNNNNVICDRPRCNRYVYRLVSPLFILILFLRQ